jgi:hypothetical protein
MNAIPTEAANEKYYVELYPSFWKPSRFEAPLTPGLTIQNALKDSGALRKFRGMDITLIRMVPEKGEPLMLQIDFSVAKNCVEVSQDYALHPNDRIVVKPSSASAIDKAVESIFGKRER